MARAGVVTAGLPPDVLAAAYRYANTLHDAAERRFANAYVSWRHGHAVGVMPGHPRVSKARALVIRADVDRVVELQEPRENPMTTRTRKRNPRALTSAEYDQLESLIDVGTLEQVLGAIQAVCHAKGQHIRESYDDGHTAKLWERAGMAVGRAENSKPVRDVSR